MGLEHGRVREIRFGSSGHMELSIACPAASIPQPGQYLLASDPGDSQAVLGTPLFTIEQSSHGFWASSLNSVPWGPGAKLDLAGPMGHGFRVPAGTHRLGLVALGETAAQLMPLVHQAPLTHWSMTLFTDLPLPSLPAALEIFPLVTLHEALDWPDYLVLDLPLARLADLRNVLGLFDRAALPCPAEVLITTPMPCAGLGACGACAVPGLRSWKLACADGPVFNLMSLRW